MTIFNDSKRFYRGWASLFIKLKINKDMQLHYYIDYEVFFRDGSSELKEETVMANNLDEAAVIAYKVIEGIEGGKEFNIIDMRQLW